MKYLFARGLRRETISRFQLGLAEPYINRDGVRHQDALTVPLRRADGAFDKRNAYYRIPGLTFPEDDRKGWMKGNVATYYSDRLAGQPFLIIVEGMKDIWRLWQQLEDWGVRKDYLLITSTHGSALPESWRRPERWQRWAKVYLSHDVDAAGDKMAMDIASCAGRDCHRVKLPTDGRKGYDWTDWLNERERTFDEFRVLLDVAQPVSLPQPSEDGGEHDTDVWDGTYQVERINAHGAFLKGHLYYATEVESRTNVMNE